MNASRETAGAGGRFRCDPDPSLRPFVVEYWAIARDLAALGGFTITPDCFGELICCADDIAVGAGGKEKLPPCFFVGLLHEPLRIEAAGVVRCMAARLRPWSVGRFLGGPELPRRGWTDAGGVFGLRLAAVKQMVWRRDWHPLAGIFDRVLIIVETEKGHPSMVTAEALMTAEEFGQRPDPGYPEELVQGRIVDMPPPDRRHGYVCSKADRIFGSFVEQHELGRVMSNDSGVITERDPDTVRGADVAYYSYARLPRGPLSTGYGPEVPELVIEVRSAHDSWREIIEKVAEYLRAGVLAVIVLDPTPQTVHVFGAMNPPSILGPDDELILPGILEGFGVRVGRFFE